MALVTTMGYNVLREFYSGSYNTFGLRTLHYPWACKQPKRPLVACALDLQGAPVAAAYPSDSDGQRSAAHSDQLDHPSGGSAHRPPIPPRQARRTGYAICPVRLGHHERLARRARPTALNPLDLRRPVHRHVDHLAGRPTERASHRNDDRSSRPQNLKSSTTFVPSRSASRASQMNRPSSTSRFPAASGSPNKGIIQASGLSRSAACSAARLFACMVLPAPGRPTN